MAERAFIRVSDCVLSSVGSLRRKCWNANDTELVEYTVEAFPDICGGQRRGTWLNGYNQYGLRGRGRVRVAGITYLFYEILNRNFQKLFITFILSFSIQRIETYVKRICKSHNKEKTPNINN